MGRGGILRSSSLWWLGSLTGPGFALADDDGDIAGEFPPPTIAPFSKPANISAAAPLFPGCAKLAARDASCAILPEKLI